MIATSTTLTNTEILYEINVIPFHPHKLIVWCELFAGNIIAVCSFPK